MGDWSQLPLDIITLIVDRLHLRDSIRLGCVCVPWRYASAPSRHKGRLPWLLQETITGNALFSVLDNQLHKMDVPHLSDRRICGSSNGWLITIHENSDIVLLNPFSLKTVYLPPVTNIPGVYGMTYMEGQLHYMISDEQTKPTRGDATLHNSVAVRDTYIQKAIVSSARVVIGIVGQFRKLLFYTPRANKWFILENATQFFDVAFYKDQFYGLDSVGTAVVVDGLDSGKPFTTTIVAGDDHDFDSLYLVESSGDLLKVVQSRVPTGQQTDNNVVFKVFKLDFQQGKWAKIDNLDDRAIFLSSTHSSSVSTIGFHGCKANCIYLVDNGILKYNLEDDTINEIFSDKDPVLSTPTWYASMQGQW